MINNFVAMGGEWEMSGEGHEALVCRGLIGGGGDQRLIPPRTRADGT